VPFDVGPHPAAGLPPWRAVLAVVAHPDDESFGLGAVLSTFVAAGAAVTVLCLTHGEASTLHGVAGDLEQVRGAELAGAAEALGLDRVELLDYPDAHLDEVDLGELVDRVAATARAVRPDGLVVFDPSGVTGHPDHVRATAAALGAAESHGLPVLGWTLPATVAAQLRREHGAPFTGHSPYEIAFSVTVDRARQLRAVACHPSQAVPGSVLWHRLELLGDQEHLRWLRPLPTVRAPAADTQGAT
jgi:LmbE family N-acetylglucosaminyl deacetylase